MSAVAATVRPRHWSLALGAAVLLHGGLLVAFHSILDGGTVAPGIGGIEVGLPPAGAAPGAPAESKAAEASPVAPVEAAPVEAAAVPPAPAEEAAAFQEVEPASGPPPREAAVAPEAVPLYSPVETVEAVEPPEEEVVVESLPPDEPEVVEPVEQPVLETPAPVEPEVAETEEIEPVEEVVAETPMAVPPPPKAKPEPPVVETPVAEAPVADAPQAVTTPEAEPGETQTASTGPQDGPPAEADELVGNDGKAGSGDRTASGAAEGHSAGGAPGAFVDYKAQLAAWLEKHKEYPRRARLRRQEGIALLQFVMDRSGKVLEYRILESSGYKLLDDEVMAMIVRASPLPKPPAAMAGERFEYEVPVWFNQR